MQTMTDTRRAQATAALAVGQRLRLMRAEQRQRVAKLPPDAGLRAVGALVETVPPCMASAQLGDVLCWPHRWSRVRMRALLGRLEWHGRTWRDVEHVRLDALTGRERDMLLAVIAERLDEGVRY